MKVLIGASLVALLTVGVVTCPAQIRAKAQAATSIPPEIQQEMSRQLSAFAAVMEGDRPDLLPEGSR